MSACGGVISGTTFSHLAGIRVLDMKNCAQSSLASTTLHHLASVEDLNMDGCIFEVDRGAFSWLRSLTCLSRVSSSLSTIPAALRVF